MSKILDNVHKSAKRLHDANYIDNVTMREFDALCLPPKRDFSAEDVKQIRAKSCVSQTVFASVLGVGKTTVQQWEQGLKKPSGPAVRLLDIVDRKGLSYII